MISVEQLIDDIIRREGGYVNHPNDRGGPTKYGITIKTLENWLGRKATIADVQALDIETAHEIYAQVYFYAPRINSLPNSVQALVCDMAVNHGPRRAVRMTQEVVNLAGFGPIDEDGVLGPQSARAIARASSEMGPFFINALVERREELYRSIVRNDPSQKAFIRGWLNRAEEFRIEIGEAA